MTSSATVFNLLETGGHRPHEMQTENRERLRIKIVAEASLDALIRVLQCLQAPNVLPLRFNAIRASVRGSKEVLEIEIDTAASDLSPDAFRLLIAKINQLPLVLTTAG